MARGEQTALDGAAVLVRLDTALPVPLAGGRVRGHISRQH